jgi:hypothetical protein
MSNIKLKKITESISQLTNRNVQVIAVTKHRAVEEIREVILSGAQVVGENRVEEAFEKFISLGLKNEFPEVSLHMIGHLQTRKVKKAVQIFDCIQSLDSLKLARKINSACGDIGKVMDVFIETNISGEKQKYGVGIEAVEETVEEIIKLPNICLRGLMTMAPFTHDKKILRKTFGGLRNLSEKLSNKFGEEYFQILSMGMSNDYKVAIEEGANMVRIGTAIFV